MRFRPRAAVLVVALLATGSLLAADPDNRSAVTDSSPQNSEWSTEQDGCMLDLPPLPSTGLSPDKLASLLLAPGSTPLNPADTNRSLGKAVACAHALDLRVHGENNTPSATAGASSGADES